MLMTSTSFMFADELTTEVLLGDPALTAGIPGEGPLTSDQIAAWLADRANHAPIEPRLPFGLSAGAKDMQGIAENPLTLAKIELGRQLFFDTRLSIDDTLSCASCHNPDHGYAAESQFALGVRDQNGPRNSPAAYNRLLSGAQFWDGRAKSLEDQAVGPIANPLEMGNSHEACAEALEQIAGYRQQFEVLFDDGVTIDNVGRVLASFERVLVTGPAPWDYYDALAKFEKAYAEDLEDIEYLREEDPELLAEWNALKAASAAQPISASARRGGALFFDERSACTKCHVGANFTDEMYHNLGVGLEDRDDKAVDLGRYDVSGAAKDRGAFKTPTLRNVAQTAPYMHDGSQATLAEVVAWYVKGGHPNPHLSEKIKPLKITKREEQDLVEFMKALTGELPKVERGRLPQ